MTNTTKLPVLSKVSQLLTENSTQLAKLLPKVITPARFASIVINVIQEDDNLQQCTATSLVRCIFQSAQLGLTPGLRRQSYLVPFNNKKKNCKEAQLLIGYQGLMDLARRSGEIYKIDAKEVYEGDIFRYTDGYDDSLVHEPISKVRVDEADPIKRWEYVTHCYAWAKLKNGERQKVVMTRRQIEGHRDRYSKAADVGPWKTNAIEMALKTVLRELCNLLPSSDDAPSLAHAYALDTQVQLGQEQTIEIENFKVEGLEDESVETGGSEGGQSKQEAKDQTATPKLPDFWDYAGREMRDPNVPFSALEWYLKVKTEGLNKPGRERFAVADRQTIKDLEAEIQRRREAEQAVATKEKAAPQTHATTVKNGTEKKTAAPAETKADQQPTEEQWQAWVKKESLDNIDAFVYVKEEYHCKNAREVPKHKRLEFMRRFQEVLEKGK